jgi:hypothetical protein
MIFNDRVIFGGSEARFGIHEIPGTTDRPIVLAADEPSRGHLDLMPLQPANVRRPCAMTAALDPGGDCTGVHYIRGGPDPSHGAYLRMARFRSSGIRSREPMRCASRHPSSFFAAADGVMCMTGVTSEGASVVGPCHRKVPKKAAPVVTMQAARRMFLFCLSLSIAALGSTTTM